MSRNYGLPHRFSAKGLYQTSSSIAAPGSHFTILAALPWLKETS